MKRPLAICLALTAAACGPRGATTRAGDAPGGACSRRLPDAQFVLEPPPALPQLDSHITLDVHAETRALERELAKQIPVTLAAESNRPVGTPGEVSYSVRRGGIGLALDGDRLNVRVPVQIEVEICKPLGPFCPVYGRCSPTLAAVASVPLLLGENYEIGRSKVSIAQGRSCVIAGLDAGPTIRREADREIGNVQARIDRALPDIRPGVASVWELLHHPVLLGTSTCLRIAPKQIAQARPVLSGGVLTARLSAKGRISVEEPCTEPNRPIKADALPPLQTLERLDDGVELAVPMRVEWKTVSTELTRVVSEQTSTTALHAVSVEAHATRGGEHGLVALYTTLAGPTCGGIWLLAEPWFDPTTARVRMRSLRVAPGQPQVDGIEGVLTTLEGAGGVALPVDVSAGPSALETLVRSFTQGLPPNVRVAASVAPARVDRVLMDGDSLVPIATFNGSATLELK